jgi:hypothetical protein
VNKKWEAHLDDFRRWDFINGNKKLFGLGIDVTNVNSSLVVEVNKVSFSYRDNGDVELFGGRVGSERLDDECVKNAFGMFDLDFLAHSLHDPRVCFRPRRIEFHEPSFASPEKKKKNNNNQIKKK